MDAIEYFEKNSYVIIKDILPKEVTKFIYNYFVMKGCTNQDFSTSLDQGEDISLKACYGDLNAETICSFLENSRYEVHLDQWEITILPCINPYGFENDTRENHDNQDLNRLFKDQLPPLEVQLAKSTFKPSYFDITIELHEDSDSHGYYLFQKSNQPNGLEIGFKIIGALKEIIPINFDEIIESMPAEKGVIHRIKDIEEMAWWPMAGYSLAMKSGHCLTLETPTQLAMSTRVSAHLVALDQALMYCSQKKPQC